MPAPFLDAFNVLLFKGEGGAWLVAAIALVNPRNKDREAQRRAFAIPCASHLGRGLSPIVVDFVTSRRANLHHGIGKVLGQAGPFALPARMALYGIADRPIIRDEEPRIEIGPAPPKIGRPLPVLPLSLNAEILLAIDPVSTATVPRCHRRLVSSKVGPSDPALGEPAVGTYDVSRSR